MEKEVKTNIVVNSGIGVFGALFLILFTLKLLGKITTSWLLVTLPLWWPAPLILFCIFAVCICITFEFVVDKIYGK